MFNYVSTYRRLLERKGEGANLRVANKKGQCLYGDEPHEQHYFLSLLQHSFEVHDAAAQAELGSVDLTVLPAAHKLCWNSVLLTKPNPEHDSLMQSPHPLQFFNLQTSSNSFLPRLTFRRYFLH